MLLVERTRCTVSASSQAPRSPVDFCRRAEVKPCQANAHRILISKSRFNPKVSIGFTHKYADLTLLFLLQFANKRCRPESAPAWIRAMMFHAQMSQNPASAAPLHNSINLHWMKHAILPSSYMVVKMFEATVYTRRCRGPTLDLSLSALPWSAV